MVSVYRHYTLRCDIKNIAQTAYMYFYKCRCLTWFQLPFHRHPHSSSASSALLHSAACGTLSGHSRCSEEILLWTSFALHQLRAGKGKTTRVLLCRRTGTGYCLCWIFYDPSKSSKWRYDLTLCFGKNLIRSNFEKRKGQQREELLAESYLIFFTFFLPPIRPSSSSHFHNRLTVKFQK